MMPRIVDVEIRSERKDEEEKEGDNPDKQAVGVSPHGKQGQRRQEQGHAAKISSVLNTAHRQVVRVRAAGQRSSAGAPKGTGCYKSQDVGGKYLVSSGQHVILVPHVLYSPDENWAGKYRPDHRDYYPTDPEALQPFAVSLTQIDDRPIDEENAHEERSVDCKLDPVDREY